jgi:iron complex transport system substrate-binding protein
VGGALTEIVYALGLESLLVGTDTTSVYPAAAQAKPKVGYFRQLSAEGVLSLKPTAVVSTSEAGPSVVMDQLRSAGVRVVQIAVDHTWNEVRRKIEAVGLAVDQPDKAQALWKLLDAEWQRTQSRVTQLVQARRTADKPLPKVLFLLSHSGTPLASGEGTAADAIIRFIGARNAVAGAHGFRGYKPLTAESMAAAAPDVILTSTQSIEAVGGEDSLWKRPELQLTPAYQNRNAVKGTLIHLDALELLGFGPRMPTTVAVLAQRVLS